MGYVKGSAKVTKRMTRKDGKARYTLSTGITQHMYKDKDTFKITTVCYRKIIPK